MITKSGQEPVLWRDPQPGFECRPIQHGRNSIQSDVAFDRGRDQTFGQITLAYPTLHPDRSCSLGRVSLNPAIDRRIVDHDAALAHHLLKITIAYAAAAIPPDRLKNGFTLEVAALEVRHPILPSSRESHLIDRLQGL